MKEYSNGFLSKLKKIDLFVLICPILLSFLSCLLLWGGKDVFESGGKKFAVQVISALIGILIMLLLSTMDYETVFSRFEIWFFFISIGLMLLTIVMNLGSSKTNKNWISIPGIPFNIQPAEIVKVFFIVTFSRHCDRVKKEINKPKNVFFLALHAGIICGLILITGDLGTVLIYMAIIAVILFMSGLSLWYFIGIGIVFVLIFPIVWSRLAYYQQMRIIAGFNPEIDPTDYGYQAIMSKKAIIAGGFKGAGLTGGTVYSTVPESHSDFIFCVLAEKFGFIGTFLYIAVMIVLVIRIFILAYRSRKNYASLICVGFAAMLIAQMLENIGMCLALLPVIGITLPFFSYGGSSMISMYLCMGVIQSIVTNNEKYYFSRDNSQ